MNRGIIEHKKGMAVAAMTAFLVILFFTLICVGRYPISPLRAFEIMGKSLLGNTEGLDAYESSVILSIRLPRILMGLLVGAAFCHNFGLAAGAAAAATETAEAVSGGLTPAGKTVLVVSIGVLFLIGFKKREKTEKK